MRFLRKIKFGLKFIMRYNVLPINIFLTRRCNFQCKYCRVIKRNNGVELSPNKWKQIIDEQMSKGYMFFKFMGGEPLLYKGLEELIDHVYLNGCFPDIATNLTFLNEKNVHKLRNLDMLGFSFDSISPISASKKVYAYQAEKLKLLQKYAREFGWDVYAITVITSKNIQEIPEVVKKVTELEFRCIPCLVESGKGDFWYRSYTPELEFKTPNQLHQLKDLVERLKKMKKQGYRIEGPDEYFDDIYRYAMGERQIKCYAGDRFIALNNDGRIMACEDKFTKPDKCNCNYFSKWSIEYLMTHPFKSMWFNFKSNL